LRIAALQGEAPEKIKEAIEDIAEIYQEVRQDLKQGKSL